MSSWETQYASKLRTAEEALRAVRSDMRVYIQPGCAEPETLVEALLKRAPFVRNVEVVHLLTLGCADYVAPEMAGHFRHNAFFIGGNVRAAVNDGRADYTPIYLSEVEDLFESGAMPLDVALIQVSPPDAHGFCSFGVGVDTTLTAARCARHVVAQDKRLYAAHIRRQFHSCQPNPRDRGVFPAAVPTARFGNQRVCTWPLP